MEDLSVFISVFVFIFMGIVARRLSLLDEKIIRTMYKFLFTLPLPIVVAVSLANAQADTSLLALPIIGALVAVSLVSIGYLVGKALHFERKMHGALVTAAGITSTLTFALPFILIFYGESAARQLFLYDFGGAIVVWTFVYYVSGRMGNKRGQTIPQTLLGFIKTPMIWALVVGLTLSFAKDTLPTELTDISSSLGSFTSVLILMGIGVFFNFDLLKHKKNFSKLLAGILLTTVVSTLLAYLFTLLFGLSDIERNIVLIAAIAPTGALTIPFCAEHDLDVEYASALVVLPMAISVVAAFVLLAAT